MKISFERRFSTEIAFTVEIGDGFSCKSIAVQRGEGIKQALKEKTDLSGTDLRGVDLRGANLRGADLSGADLRGADLRGVDLRGVDLYGANLRGADLRFADLSDTDLRGADLRGADLGGAKNIPELIAARTSILADGDIIGWKKCRVGKIVKLKIPAAAKRSNATGRKCRAECAEVLAIYEGDKEVKEAISQHDYGFKYVVGETVKPKEPFCEDRFDECASGIHFYITRIEAENH